MGARGCVDICSASRGTSGGSEPSSRSISARCSTWKGSISGHLGQSRAISGNLGSSARVLHQRAAPRESSRATSANLGQPGPISANLAPRRACGRAARPSTARRVCSPCSTRPPRGSSPSRASPSGSEAEVQPRCSRGAAEARPRCSRGAAEVRPRCEVQPRG